MSVSSQGTGNDSTAMDYEIATRLLDYVQPALRRGGIGLHQSVPREHIAILLLQAAIILLAFRIPGSYLRIGNTKKISRLPREWPEAIQSMR